MKILRWSGGQPAGYRFDCPEWIRDGFRTGTLYGYVCVDEEEACAASYLAFYLSDDAAEVIAHGVMEGYDPAYTLGRLYARLRQHCREREIARIEEEIIGQVPEDVENVLLREDFFRQEGFDGMWRMTPVGREDGQVPYNRNAIRPAEGLDGKERESLIALMMTVDGEEEAGYDGSLIPELCALYWQDGRAAACVFCADYRGIIRADRVYVLPGCEDCLRSLWMYIREEAARVRPGSSGLYLPQISAASCLWEGTEPVGVHLWRWIDEGMDSITFREAVLEADLSQSDAGEMGALMLTRLYPFAHMLEEEGEEYDMSLDGHMLPQIMVTVHSLGTDRMMEVGCRMTDWERGEFLFPVQTEFAGYKDAVEGAYLCSRINGRMERATAYWDGKESIMLRGYALEDECSDVVRWRKFLRDWTMDCHMAGMVMTDFTEQGPSMEEWNDN